MCCRETHCMHCVAECVAVCCRLQSVLQCVAVYCSVLQCVFCVSSHLESFHRRFVAVCCILCCSVLQSVLQSMLQCVADCRVCCSVLQSNTLQRCAKHCNTLPRSATGLNMLQHALCGRVLQFAICGLVALMELRVKSCDQICVAECCRVCCRVKVMSQHTATHCNTLQHTATHCCTLQHTAIHCNTLQHTAAHCNTLQHTTTHCNTLHAATYYNALQHTATHCDTLQHTATHRNTHLLQHPRHSCSRHGTHPQQLHYPTKVLGYHVRLPRFTHILISIGVCGCVFVCECV